MTMESSKTVETGPRTVQTAPADWTKQLVAAMLDAGVRVMAPVDRDGSVELDVITDAAEMTEKYLNSVVPAKKAVFPPTEVLLTFENELGNTNFEPVADDTPETVVVGCRPCDAAAIDRLATVFQWDYDDKPFLDRLNKTTFVTFACTQPDENCFCTSVGLGPADTEGSDILVQPASDGVRVAVMTDKGEKIVSAYGKLDNGDSETAMAPGPEIDHKFDVQQVKEWLDNNFDSPFWSDLGLRCVGCGVCSFTCPTCHCFDIVDESEWSRGERRRNWDSCAFGLFTLHTSGHNPRSDQSARFRQRVMHKFKYFPERFDQLGCVGCGRCIRQCPAGQDLMDILQQMKQGEE
jgi:ferredoxin